MHPFDKDLEPRIARILTVLAPPAVISAYLYGSTAEDRAHRESDVDVGVLLRWDLCPTARERFQQHLEISAPIGAQLGGQTLDLVVLNDAPPELGRHIVTRGRRVYCADGEADHALVRDVQLRAADLQPFLRRARKIKLDALAP